MLTERRRALHDVASVPFASGTSPPPSHAHSHSQQHSHSHSNLRYARLYMHMRSGPLRHPGSLAAPPASSAFLPPMRPPNPAPTTTSRGHRRLLRPATWLARHRSPLPCLPAIHHRTADSASSHMRPPRTTGYRDQYRKTEALHASIGLRVARHGMHLGGWAAPPYAESGASWEAKGHAALGRGIGSESAGALPDSRVRAHRGAGARRRVGVHVRARARGRRMVGTDCAAVHGNPVRYLRVQSCMDTLSSLRRTATFSIVIGHALRRATYTFTLHQEFSRPPRPQVYFFSLGKCLRPSEGTAQSLSSLRAADRTASRSCALYTVRVRARTHRTARLLPGGYSWGDELASGTCISHARGYR
ncbi:hypothetical protein C2E23DRAFT_593323 [Lenzites betulinus]|nr:hypothetical protein C2E23DRAFT_593323 [Lenzites betulinus]